MFRKASVVLTCLALAGALTLDGAEAASRAKGGQLRGRTAQGKRIRLKLRSGSVQLMRFDIRLRCRNGTILTDEESGFVPTEIGAGGHLRDAQVGSTDEVLFRGRLQGERLRGRLRVRDRIEGARCDSGWVHFTASGD